MTVLRRPRATRTGVDLAGQVEDGWQKCNAVQNGRRCVRCLHHGSTSFGRRSLEPSPGALAEYVCAPEATLARKPDNVTFEQAASVPVAAFTALQGLREEGRVEAGPQVLINGAAGGVGTCAVQIANWLGTDVTAVCSSRNADMVRSIGADHVVDYAREDFTDWASAGAR